MINANFFKEIELKILEARNNPTDLIICQTDLDQYTESFFEFLEEQEENHDKISFFMSDYFQNLQTPKENIKAYWGLEE